MNFTFESVPYHLRDPERKQFWALIVSDEAPLAEVDFKTPNGALEVKLELMRRIGVENDEKAHEPYMIEWKVNGDRHTPRQSNSTQDDPKENT